MIRVLHTIDTTGPGGAETVFTSLAAGLDRRRFESFAAITGPGWVGDELRRSGINPLFIPARGGFNLPYLRALVRIVWGRRIDVIQSHLLGSNVYCSLAGLICRVPVFSTFHGFVDGSRKNWLTPVKRTLINAGSRKIVFVSDRLRGYFTEGFGLSAAKSVTIYNGVDTGVFRPRRDERLRKELGLGRRQILVGAVGNIRPAKGYEFFLRAAALVLERHPSSRFVVVGEGSGPTYAGLLELRRQLRLEDRFSFVGFRDDVPAILNNFDLFVLPSISEGLSIATLEALACRVPVVVTRSGGPEEIVRDRVNGFICEAGNEASMAECICQWIDTGRTSRIGNRRWQIEEKFTCKAMLRTYSDFYEEYADKKNDGRLA